MARDKIYLEEEFPTPLMQLWHNFKQPPVVLIGFGAAQLGTYDAAGVALIVSGIDMLISAFQSEKG